MDPNKNTPSSNQPDTQTPAAGPMPSQGNPAQPSQPPQFQPPQPQVFNPPTPAPAPPQPNQVPTPQPQQFQPPQPPAEQPGAQVSPPAAQVPTPPTPPVLPPSPAPSYGAMPQPGYLPNQSGSRRKFVVIGFVIFLAVILVASLLLIFGSGGSGADVVDRSDGTLDLSNLINPQETIRDQDITAKLNQQVNLSSGLSFMVTGFERNWSSPELVDTYYELDDEEYVKVDLVMGNRDEKDSNYVSVYSFVLETVDGEKVTPQTIRGERFLDKALDSADLEPGEQASGSLLYVVDKGSELSGIVMSEKYELIGTDKTATISVKVTLE